MKITEGDETYGMILTFDEDGANSIKQEQLRAAFQQTKRQQEVRGYSTSQA